MAFLDHDYDKYPELTNSQLQVLWFSSPHKQLVEDFDAFVVKVHDADTVTLRTESRDFDFPLRLLDIDAPELSEGGLEAQKWLESRLLGKVVRVLVDSSNRVGKYGRLLGRILSSGLDVGEQMLYLGLVKRFGRKDEGHVPSIHKLMRSRQWF